MTPEAHNRPTDFSIAASPVRVGGNEWTLTAGTDWSQGRTLFGGLVGAAVANAMSAQLAPDLQLRTLSAVFAAPISPGVSHITTHIDRVGSSTAFTSATVSQEGKLRSRAQAVFARTRESTVTVEPTPPKMTTPFDEAPELPYIEGVVPVFIQHFDVRWGIGDYPFTGSSQGTLGGYLRHKPPLCGAAAVLGLLDAWPPAVLPMATGPAFASSVSWTAHILRDPPTEPDAWYTFRYDTVAAEQGYATTVGSLSCEGKVIAWTEQLVAVFG